MKKTKLIALILVLVLSLSFNVGCGIGENWDKINSNFKKAGYDSSYSTEYVDISFVLDSLSIYGSHTSDIKCALSASSYKEIIFILFCKDSSTAGLLKGAISKTTVGAIAMTAKVTRYDISYDTDGSVFYIGTKEAIKIAKRKF